MSVYLSDVIRFVNLYFGGYSIIEHDVYFNTLGNVDIIKISCHKIKNKFSDLVDYSFANHDLLLYVRDSSPVFISVPINSRYNDSYNNRFVDYCYDYFEPKIISNTSEYQLNNIDGKVHLTGGLNLQYIQSIKDNYSLLLLKKDFDKYFIKFYEILGELEERIFDMF